MWTGLLWTGVTLAAADVSRSEAVASRYQASGGGDLTPRLGHDDTSPALQKRLLALQQQALESLQDAGRVAPVKLGIAQTFDWPVKTAPGSRITDRWGISNFVDHNAQFPDKLLDYSCGARTYDTTDGYNHAGVDIFTFPFSWQAMAQDAQVVVAAAPGTLIFRLDGNYDRNCSFDATGDPNLVFIQHDDGTVAWYLHMKSGSVIDVPIGTRIEAGTRLGVVGSSGISTAPHLHFEVHAGSGNNAPLIDPYQGQCQTQPSRWNQQPDYRDPELLTLDTYFEAPTFSPGCGVPATPRFRRQFQPGDLLVVSGMFRDMHRGDSFVAQLFRPDGELYASNTANTSGNSEEYYTAAYWYYSYQLPDDAMQGVWRARWTQNGQSKETRFLVGNLQNALSGAWYNPQQSGHGLFLEVLDIGTSHPALALTWYAYHDGEPMWLTGLGDILPGQTTVPVYSRRGADFPPDFDPADIQTDYWGSVEVTSVDAGNTTISWSPVLPGYQAGSMNMQRLTQPSDVNTDGHDSGLRACYSGGWYDPAQSGQGLFAEVLGGADSRLLAVAWYAYHDGKPFWLTGAGEITGNTAEITLGSSTSGEFPPDFDPQQSMPATWGTLTWRFDSPNASHISWDAELPGFEDGEMDLSRLTTLMDAPCL